MPQMPKVPKVPPGKRSGERRSANGNGSPPSLIMQGYENMGRSGRRKLMWMGMAMMTAGGGVGLFADALSFYRFIIVLVFVGVGTGFVFPQFGIWFLERIFKMIPMIAPTKFLNRPDRRNDDPEEPT